MADSHQVDNDDHEEGNLNNSAADLWAELETKNKKIADLRKNVADIWVALATKQKDKLRAKDR